MTVSQSLLISTLWGIKGGAFKPPLVRGGLEGFDAKEQIPKIYAVTGIDPR